jgi:uncharacterized protein (DUF924 family)
MRHLVKDAALDATIGTRFGVTLEAAVRCELFAWRTTAEGRLKEILVWDRFSRNVYRVPRHCPRICEALSVKPMVDYQLK